MSIFVGLFSLGSQYRFFTSEPTARIFPTKSCPKILIVFFSCESESCTTSRNALRYQIPRSDPQKPAYRTLRMTDVASPGLLPSSRNGAGTSRRKKPLEFSHPSFFMSSVSALILITAQPRHCKNQRFQYSFRSSRYIPAFLVLNLILVTDGKLSTI